MKCIMPWRNDLVTVKTQLSSRRLHWQLLLTPSSTPPFPHPPRPPHARLCDPRGHLCATSPFSKATRWQMGSWLELAGRALVFVVVGVMGGVTFRRFWQKEKARARLPRRTRTPAGWAAPVAHLCHFVCGTCHHLYARVRRSMRVPPEHARRPPLRASHTLPARGRDHSVGSCAWPSQQRAHGAQALKFGKKD